MLRSLIIVCLVVSACLAVTCPSYSQTFARVAAWNQQGVSFDTQGTIHKVSKPAELRAAIAAINPDVIALSEVNSRESLDEIVATPFANGARYKVDMDNNQPVPQMIAVLFKDSPNISVSNRRVIPGSDEGQPDRLRQAWAFDEKISNFDFLLIAVHLKSGRETEEREIRTCQVRAISRFIAAHTEATGEKDVLVVGDYNMVPTQDQRNFANLSPGKQNNEFLRFISSTLSGPSHIGHCTNASDFTGNLLDGFSISRLHTPEWTGYIRVQQLQAQLPNMWCGKFKTTISDHLPLVARFRVDGADDD